MVYLFVFDYTNVRLEFPELKKHLIAFYEMWGDYRSKFHIEPKANGKSIVQDLRRNTNLNVLEHKMIEGDKIARLTAVSPTIEAGKIVIVKKHLE